MSRPLPAATYNALKTAWKQLLGDVGGVDATAACTRATRSLASDYGNVNSDRFAPADIVLEAETIGGRPHVTMALARAQGYELVPVEAHERSDLARMIARIGKDAAEVFATAGQALADQRLTESEIDALLRELDTLRRDAADGIFALRQQGARLLNRGGAA